MDCIFERERFGVSTQGKEVLDWVCCLRWVCCDCSKMEIGRMRVTVAGCRVRRGMKRASQVESNEGGGEGRSDDSEINRSQRHSDVATTKRSADAE